MTIENNLKEIRKEKGLSTYELAKLTGISQPQIVYLENGRRKFTVEWANKIAPFLDVTPAQLLGFEPYNKISNNESVNNNLGSDSDIKITSKKSLPKPLNTKKDYVTVNMYTQEFACGNGIEPLNYEECNKVILDKFLLRNLTTNIQYVIIVKAIGDSMNPLIKDKSFVLIDTADIEIKNSKNTLKNVFAFRLNNDLCIKHLTLNKKTNTIKALSSNLDKDKYPDISIKLDDTSDFKIIGRVLATFNWF